MIQIEYPNYYTNKMKNDFHKSEIKTPQSLLDKGMYVCSVCGALNCVDEPNCKNCKTEKFIVT